MLAEVQTYKNRMANKFANRFLYAWTFPLSVEKCIEHPKLLCVLCVLCGKKIAKSGIYRAVALA